MTYICLIASDGENVGFSTCEDDFWTTNEAEIRADALAQGFTASTDYGTGPVDTHITDMVEWRNYLRTVEDPT
jgi:hypothetical protein